MSLNNLKKQILDTFDNPQLKDDYLINMRINEFTCLCPLTGQPDFAEFSIDYVPDKLCVELKSLKLYMASYRDEGAFHEDVTNRILNDICQLIKPKCTILIGYWKIRGGITTTVTTKYYKKGWKDINKLV
ncbi:MAG: NADPH-dependent 7-cyano-7-deazaguanine reductase QueF [Gammaproteobacteria bacterium]|nr:NADPH-dependent 7-cyano-7-deazaguanine reductase QueF [Gammaproteobacteria bacterium]|tara:strand:+ start:1698 stop:2087 length:390 start_codon:yes stop_codon:yes gene_type:complete